MQSEYFNFIELSYLSNLTVGALQHRPNPGFCHCARQSLRISGTRGSVVNFGRVICFGGESIYIAKYAITHWAGVYSAHLVLLFCTNREFSDV